MKLGNATREYVANKKATGMVFEAEAYILRAFTEKLGASMSIKKITSDSVLDYLNGHGPVTLFWHRKHDALSVSGGSRSSTVTRIVLRFLCVDRKSRHPSSPTSTLTKNSAGCSTE
jgi:hypothetical protein